MRTIRNLLLICALPLFVWQANAQTPYEKKTAKLMTIWGENMQPTDPILPEYPRPQMVREKWLNLNGIWQFQPAGSATEALPAGNLAREILVPFPVESALSGIMEQGHKHLWYRRSFTVPAGWSGERVLLHFEAVDHSCEVFINGVSAGTHEGGYDPFYFDITSHLTSAVSQDIAVRVTDYTDEKGYPRGKQTLYPAGIMFTPTTGIWQTVWLEAVPQQAYISRIRMVPNIDNATLKFYTEGVSINGLKVRFKIYDNATKIATIEENYRSDYYTLNIPKPIKLWSPDSPFLYDMNVYLLNNTGEVIDSVSTYFGMRKISKQFVDGYHRIMLNNEVLFNMGPLDQGYWPDGNCTAPHDDALRFDVEKTKALGFNMIRKHIKIEPRRWYHWCDKLGMLVWQDMPSVNSYPGDRPTPPIERDAFKRELEAMIKNHWNSPAIVVWILFNERQGSHDSGILVPLMQSWDNSRLIDLGSGGPSYDLGDIHDYHNYPAPVCPPGQNTQALVCGEFGAIPCHVPGHVNIEGSTNTFEQLLEQYKKYADILIYLKSHKGLNAGVYCQTADTESEMNGLITYDRKVIKGNPEDHWAVNQQIINEYRYYDAVIPTSEDTPQAWRYTTAAPAGGWETSAFDDSSWAKSFGSFGLNGTTGATVRTPWETDDIWVRRKFTLPADAFDDGEKLFLRIYNNDVCEIYINGTPAFALPYNTNTYVLYEISPAAKATLIKGSENTIAIHCKNHTWTHGQYIDMGVLKIAKTAGSGCRRY